MQHDFTFDNQPGASLRGDLNEAMLAVVGQSSGDAAPAVTYPFMWWMDTATWLLKQRNAGNTAWMTQAAIIDGQLVPYAGGESADERYALLAGENDFDQVPTVKGTPLAVGGSAVWTTMPVGMPFPLYDFIPGIELPPNDNPNYRYVKLSAGQDGAGQYNYGVLEAESVSGSAPLIIANALVNLPGSPFDGRRIKLINTDKRFIGAGEGGILEDDSIQNITGAIASRNYQPTGGASGAFRTNQGSAGINQGEQHDTTASGFSFDASRVARTADHTQPRTIRVPHYVRIL